MWGQISCRRTSEKLGTLVCQLAGSWVTNTGITFDSLRVRPEKSGVSGGTSVEPTKSSVPHVFKGLTGPEKADRDRPPQLVCLRFADKNPRMCLAQ